MFSLEYHYVNNNVRCWFSSFAKCFNSRLFYVSWCFVKYYSELYPDKLTLLMMSFIRIESCCFMYLEPVWCETCQVMFVLWTNFRMKKNNNKNTDHNVKFHAFFAVLWTVVKIVMYKVKREIATFNVIPHYISPSKHQKWYFH